MSQAKEELRWALIGASDIAKTRMIKAINSQPNSRVAAVFSSNADRAKAYAAENKIPKAYDNLKTLLDDPQINVVYISTTNDLHRDQALAAAAAGKHILCEKPLALSVDDARQMLKAAQAANVVLGTNHHLRNAVTHRTLRKLVKEGAIGKPLAARVFHAVYLPPRLQGWRLSRPEAGGGVILDITVHDTDTLRFVLDSEVEDVIARSATQGLANGGIEDAVMGVMYFRDGVLAQFHDAFTVKHAPTGLEIHGTEGSLFAQNVMTQDPVGRIVLRRDNEETEIKLDPPEDLYVHSVRHFNQAVLTGAQPFATGTDGLRSLAVALAALESSKSGRRTPVQDT
ncbi:MAG TPA: Gfo/Idh/MocA family oxidoreductase [Chthoniobacterales bacterium]|nr:Gfo/Idh/MocA family oxidoreductase [Chthoniobacterales bacterium]